MVLVSGYPGKTYYVGFPTQTGFSPDVFFLYTPPIWPPACSVLMQNHYSQGYTNANSVPIVFLCKDLDAERARLEELLHVRKELLGIGAVDDPVVIGEGEIGHLPDRDVVVAFG
jgi:hypothetical protein